VIEVRHLRYFVAVAEELHFGRAAERLHMAQSPLSHQIRQLERRLGVVLIERDHHVVGLTDAGRAFLEEAREILERLGEAAEHARRAARGEVGLLSVGFVAEMTTDLVPESLRRHREAFPGIAIELCQATTGELLEALRLRRVDVGFARSPAGAEDLEYAELTREPLYLARAARDDGQPGPVPLATLAGEPFVVPSYNTARGLRRDIDAALSRSDVAPKSLREASAATATLLLVAAGAGVALIPASLARNRSLPGIQFCELAEPVTTGAGICWRRSESSNVVLEFLGTARRVAAELQSVLTLAGHGRGW
jgi:DNA-binding transcriptional LysR family regulator